MLRLATGNRQIRRSWTKRLYHTKECFGHRRKPSQTGHSLPSPDTLKMRACEPNLWRMATAYQDYGHSQAALDPLDLKRNQELYNLHPHTFGLDESRNMSTSGILFAYPADNKRANLSEAVEYLQSMYCGNLSLDPRQLSSDYEREWLVQHYEENRHSPLPSVRQRNSAEHLLKSQAFDVFLAKKFGSVKRYSGEGAESMLMFFDELLSSSGERGYKDIVLGMPHRGRLNLLTGMLGLTKEALFHKLNGHSEFVADAPGAGDVISHLVSSLAIDGPNPLHVSLLPNPSHLEAVNPVAMGKARGRLLSYKSGPYSQENQSSQVLTVQVHGDASFSAQGIVMECFSLSAHPYFDSGGSLHLIVNNQLGFTTDAEYGHSSHHCSDVGKIISAPIIHVSGDYPEEVVRATQIALGYLKKFEKDIIINMICFRKWGHNELDNPSLTQPSMYNIINSKPSVPDSYCQQLESVGVLSPGETQAITDDYTQELNESLKNSQAYVQEQTHLLGSNWKDMALAPSSLSQWDTGCSTDLLKFIGAKSVTIPDHIMLHSRLEQSHVSERLKRLEEGERLDWATAEALAIGSLLYQGFNVRLSGQDVGRGTFSHRHAMVVCQKSDSAYIPLNSIYDSQSAFLEVANSPLSEEAVLGFEYGLSIESPQHLVIWEAQFGDFFNGAQTIIDTFVSSGESKWLLQSGLVMLLPHGYDGAGPDHSSCHVERFLQSCDSGEAGVDGDSVNMHIAHPSTPAQYYHLLRRQMLRNFRKPLIIQSPKTLLRLPAAVSRLSEMEIGTTFQPVLADARADPQQVKRVILCSGKHFYTLDNFRVENKITDTALIRIELICPFPAGSIYQELSKYPKATEFVWSQEEPENMGPWSFVKPRFSRQIGFELSLVSRKPCATAAVGVATVHREEAKQLLLDTF